MGKKHATLDLVSIALQHFKNKHKCDLALQSIVFPVVLESTKYSQILVDAFSFIMPLYFSSHKCPQ